MNTEQNYIKDIRWLHAMASKRGIEVREGQGSAFAEKVSVKLEGNDEPVAVLEARQDAFLEIFG